MELGRLEFPVRYVDPTEIKSFETKSDDDLGEYEHVGVLVARKSDLFSAAARIEGYEEHGRGAVFYREVWEETVPKATPWYMPATEPEFAGVGTEIQQAVAVYRPLSEGVVVVVTRHDEIFCGEAAAANRRFHCWNPDELMHALESLTAPIVISGIGVPLVAWARYAHRRWQESIERERFVLSMKAASTPQLLAPESAFDCAGAVVGPLGAGSRRSSDVDDDPR